MYPSISIIYKMGSVKKNNIQGMLFLIKKNHLNVILNLKKIIGNEKLQSELDRASSYRTSVSPHETSVRVYCKYFDLGHKLKDDN